MSSDNDTEAQLEFLKGPSVPYDPSYHLLWRPDRVADAARRFRPNVMEAHSQYVAAAGVLAAPVDGIRTLVWHADHLGTYAVPWLTPRLGETWSERVLAPAWAAVRALSRRFSATLVASRTQRDALRGHGAVRVHHVPFGVDRTLFRPPASPLTRPPEQRRIVALGRMAVEKRWDVLLQAFAQASADRPGWRLLALGDGPERPALEAYARRAMPAGKVEFGGFVRERSELARQLAEADVFFHACPHETFGLAVAEALACGTMAVVPDRGGASEWIDGLRTRGFRANQVNDAARVLREALEVPASARANWPAPNVVGVEEHFGHVLELYDELLARARH